MKKQDKQEKKLSLKKMQIMKVNDMRIINGGASAGVNCGGDEPLPTPLRHTFITSLR